MTKQDISEKLILNLVAENLSYNTIQKAYNNLNSMYKFALKNHHVTFNPVDPELLPNEELFEKSEPETLNEDEIYLLFRFKAEKMRRISYLTVLRIYFYFKYRHQERRSVGTSLERY